MRRGHGEAGGRQSTDRQTLQRMERSIPGWHERQRERQKGFLLPPSSQQGRGGSWEGQSSSPSSVSASAGMERCLQAAPRFSLHDGTCSPLVSFSLPPLSLRLARQVTGILLPASVIKTINSNGKLRHAGLVRCSACCNPLTNLLINLRFPQCNYFPNF